MEAVVSPLEFLAARPDQRPTVRILARGSPDRAKSSTRSARGGIYGTLRNRIESGL